EGRRTVGGRRWRSGGAWRSPNAWRGGDRVSRGRISHLEVAMRLFEPYLLQIAHRAGAVVSGEGMLQGPAAPGGGLGDVSKSDRLLGMGLNVGDGPAKCARRHRPRSTDLCR